MIDLQRRFFASMNVVEATSLRSGDLRVGNTNAVPFVTKADELAATGAECIIQFPLLADRVRTELLAPRNLRVDLHIIATSYGKKCDHVFGIFHSHGRPAGRLGAHPSRHRESEVTKT